MRHLFLAALLVPAVIAGCGKDKSAMQAGATNEVCADGLSLQVTMPRRDYRVGECFDVTVTAVNTTDEPMTIVATDSAPVYLHVQRHDLTWRTLLTYPQSAAKVMNRWTLEAGQSRSFTLRLTVGMDWPTNEPLRLAAELNGRPFLTPAVIFEVLTDQGQEAAAQ